MKILQALLAAARIDSEKLVVIQNVCSKRWMSQKCDKVEDYTGNNFVVATDRKDYSSSCRN